MKLKTTTFWSKMVWRLGASLCGNDVVLWASRYVTSQSLVHNATSSGHITCYFDHTIQIPFLKQNGTTFRHYKIVNFFPMMLKIWKHGFKM